MALPKGGLVLMPLDNYGFSKKSPGVNDRFGLMGQIA